MIITTYSHEWDETRAVFARPPALGHRGSRTAKMGMLQETMVQRGTFGWHLFARKGDVEQKEASLWEEWLVPPCIVSSTSAPSTYAGVLQGLPAPFRFDAASADDLVGMLASSDFVAFLPMGDKATSNVLLQKMWGYILHHDEGNKFSDALLYLADTCQIHAHHRAKLALASLQLHTARHYSLAHLHRLAGVQAHIVKDIENFVAQKVQRIVVAVLPPEASRASDLMFSFSTSCMTWMRASMPGRTPGPRHISATSKLSWTSPPALCCPIASSTTAR